MTTFSLIVGQIEQEKHLDVSPECKKKLLARFKYDLEHIYADVLTEEERERVKALLQNFNAR